MGFFGFDLSFNANEKEEKSQGGCAKLVLDISSTVVVSERNFGLVKILGKRELQWQQSSGAERACSCGCCPQVGQRL